MTTNEEILVAANILANQGKNPSVALIKGMLTQPTPLPQIISALKNWQHDPEFISIGKEASNEPEQADKNETELEQAINQALAPIKKELAQVKALLVELINNQSQNHK